MPQQAPEFVVDQETWDRRWAEMPALEREKALERMSRGRAAHDARFAPFAYLIARRNRRIGLAPLALLPLAILAAVGWYALEPPLIALVAVISVVFFGALTLWFLYVGQATLERNAAVLRGVPPARADATYPKAMWVRALRVMGRVVLAYFVVLFTVRALVWAAWAGLQVLGVDLPWSEDWQGVANVVWMPLAAVLTWIAYRLLWSKGPRQDKEARPT